MIDSQIRGQILQFARAVHHAYRTDVVALRKEQFNDQLAMRAKSRRYWCGPPCPRRPWSGRTLQLLLAFDFDQTQPARADVRESA